MSAIHQRTCRDKKRALGLCTRCGRKPAFERGAKTYSKCTDCLRTGAAAQAMRRANG